VGNPRNTWFACSMVDENGKEIPWVDRDGRILQSISERYGLSPGQKVKLQAFGGFGSKNPRGAYETLGVDLIQDVYERIDKGEYSLPLYADLPSMPADERRVIFGLMVGQEGKSLIPVYYTLTQAGFDPDQDMLQYYEGSWYGVGPPQWLTPSGGVVVDWDLKTDIEGLYIGGAAMGGHGAAGACSTGRYVGRKAADYAFEAGEPVSERGQIDAEKDRVYAPTRRKSGMDWKELEAGIARVMQEYCGPKRSIKLLDLGLKWLDEIKETEAREVCARNPHELMRSLEALTILTISELTIHANRTLMEGMAKRGKSPSDRKMPEPVTLRLVEGKVEAKELPSDFWGDVNNMKENYEAHCGL
jgi:hypothetical protein